MKLRWSESAIDCYNRGCVCQGCPTKEILETKCTMKKTVIDLVSKIGIPPNVPFIEGLTAQQNDILACILNGTTEVSAIAEELQIPQTQVRTQLGLIRPYFEEMGFEPKSYSTKTVDLIEFIKTEYGKEIKMYYDEDLGIDYPEKYTGVVDAIKKGYEKQIDIAREAGIKEGTICFFLNQLARHFKLETTETSSRVALCNFIRNKLFDNAGTRKEESLPQEPKPIAPLDKTEILSPCTEREEEILDLLMAGFSYEKISERLVIQMTTLKTHVNNIFQKRGYHSLQELLVKEYKKKFVSLKNLNAQTLEENKNLKEKLSSLELKRSAPDFSTVEQKIKMKIEKLQNQLSALELLKSELTEG